MGQVVSIMVALTAPKNITQDTPALFQITQCQHRKRKKRKRGWSNKANPYPGEVKLVFSERDTWTKGDDLIGKLKGSDDALFEIKGHLEANESDFGANFVPDPDSLKKAVESQTPASDRLWFAFEGSEDKAFELMIPRDPEEGEEGHFYDFAVTIAKLGTAKVETKQRMIPLTRPRTPHRILTVEPGGQGGLGAGTQMRKLIREAFYPHLTNGEANVALSQNWGNFMLKRASEKTFSSKFKKSACSLITLCSVLRYLRVPGPDGKLASVYDKVIGRKIKAKSLKAEFAPRRMDINTDEGIKASKGAYTKKAAKDALRNAMKDQGMTIPNFGDHFGVEFETANAEEGSAAWKAKAHVADFGDKKLPPVMLLWYLRQRQQLKENYDFTHHKAFIYRVKDGVVERKRFRKGDQAYPTQGKGSSSGAATMYDKGIVLPVTETVRSDFGLVRERFSSHELGADWEEKIQSYIDDNLPVMVLFSRSIYTQAAYKGDVQTDPEKLAKQLETYNEWKGKSLPGHWCLIVGYRKEKDRTHYIINDPAKRNAVQYETLREDDLQDLLDRREVTAEKDMPGHQADKPRDLMGWNIMVERRKFLSANKFEVLKPRGWDRSHGNALKFDGRSEWTFEDPPTPKTPATEDDEEG